MDAITSVLFLQRRQFALDFGGRGFFPLPVL